MKRFFLSALAVIMILSILFLTACGGGNNETSSAPTSTSKAPTTSAATTPAAATSAAATTSSAPATQASSGSGVNWDDMPVFSGASQVQKGSWSIPPQDDSDYSKMEWRYYETSGSLADISDFYKKEMPGKGWTQAGWMEVQDSAWGMFNKNDEKDAAMVWVSTQEGKSVIAMWRASK